MKKPSASREIRALIFAEGGSPHLRPLTDHLPTGLVPVGGTPILDRQIQCLLRAGVDDIVVVGGYRAAQVEQACRFYSQVEFRFNPNFSRLEPRLAALAAVGSLEEKAVLLLRGDLVFGDDLLEAVLSSKKSARVVNGKGNAIGLFRLNSDVTRTLVQAGEATMGNGGEDEDLFGFVERVVTGTEDIKAADHPWARVSTMEDLAKALQAHQRASEARVRQEEGRRAPSRAEATAPAEGSPPAKESPGEAGVDPVLDGLDADDSRPLLPRPLLKVLHR